MTPSTLYEGTKRLHATPMTRGEYNAYRGWENPAGENPSDSGYLVEYLDGGKANDSRHAGYISWSPADVFERTYKPVVTTLPVVDPGPDALEREIQAKADKAPRVTPADVKAEIVDETYTVLPSGRVTVCELTLKNGFTVRGESAVVHIENFNEGIGRQVARENAEKEIWQLLGFRLRDELAR